MKYLKKLTWNILYGNCISRASKFYSTLSFDLFDTLIFRKCGTPNSMLHYVEKAVEMVIPEENNFYKKRIMAEKVAYRNAVCSEITLDDIYCYYDSAMKNEIMKLELKCELELVLPNDYLINTLNKINKKIIIISDMYMTKEFVLTLIAKCGLDVPYEVIISSEVGLRKYDGSLYKYIKEEYNIQKWFHFGDNYHSDVQMAKVCGATVKWYWTSRLKNKVGLLKERLIV